MITISRSSLQRMRSTGKQKKGGWEESGWARSHCFIRSRPFQSPPKSLTWPVASWKRARSFPLSKKLYAFRCEVDVDFVLFTSEVYVCNLHGNYGSVTG